MHPHSRKPLNPSQPPSCPKCGCNQAELINAGLRWGKPFALFECDHCGNEFSLGARPRDTTNGHAYRVPFPKLQCPSCAGKNTDTPSSPKADPSGTKIRYHKCLDCGCNFSSYENR